MKTPDVERLERFLAFLPPGVRHAVEFRSAAWYTDEVCDLLDAYGAACCEHDALPRPPPRITGGWRYLRFHGTEGRYRGRYGRAALRPWAESLHRWKARGRDAYVYFNNDQQGDAVLDTLELLHLTGRDAGAPLQSNARENHSPVVHSDVITGGRDVTSRAAGGRARSRAARGKESNMERWFPKGSRTSGWVAARGCTPSRCWGCSGCWRWWC